MDKTIKIGIISGIIASMVFVYFLDPILRVFGNSIIYLTSWAYTGLMDSIYLKSALGAPRDPALSIFAMLSGGITGVIIGVSTSILKGNKQEKKTTKKKSTKSSRLLDMPIFVLFAPLILCALLLMYQTWSLFSQYQIVTSFNQHIRVLTPYITSKDRDTLISEFALMQSEIDFKNLYGQMNSFASSNNVKLPENPSYGFWQL